VTLPVSDRQPSTPGACEPSRLSEPGQEPQQRKTGEELLQRALSFALAQLNRRERSVAEIRGHLKRKGIGDEVAEATVHSLIADGYLDDARYALMYVHDKRELQGWGSERIRQELSRRGIDRALTETALAEHEAEAGEGRSELERALELLRRRFPTPPSERRERDRALGVLIRKGFDGELALDALAAYARQG
jgi:regulatory protein